MPLPRPNSRRNVDRTLVINDGDGVSGDSGGEGDGVVTILVAGLAEGDAGATGKLSVLL